MPVELGEATEAVSKVREPVPSSSGDWRFRAVPFGVGSLSRVSGVRSFVVKSFVVKSLIPTVQGSAGVGGGAMAGETTLLCASWLGAELWVETLSRTWASLVLESDDLESDVLESDDFESDD